MTLEEAIKHTEEVAKEIEDSAKEYYRIANLEYHPNKKDAENSYTNYMEYYKAHRQLAEWLKELKKCREENDWIPFKQEQNPETGRWEFVNPPKDGQHILITVNLPGHEPVQDDYWYWDVHGHLDSGYTPCDEAIAWRPLPEPY